MTNPIKTAGIIVKIPIVKVKNIPRAADKTGIRILIKARIPTPKVIRPS